MEQRAAEKNEGKKRNFFIFVFFSFSLLTSPVFLPCPQSESASQLVAYFLFSVKNIIFF
jgi:hypothetical protein